MFNLYRNSFIVLSHPKAGRTWLSVIFDKLLEFEFGITNYNYFHKTSYFSTSAFRHYKIEFTHGPSSRIIENPNTNIFKNRNIVFLIRDPKDIIVSYYYQRTIRKQLFSGTISEFIRDKNTGIAKVVNYHNIIDGYRDTFSKYILLKYEDMCNDLPKQICRLLNYFDLKISSKTIEDVSDWVTFSKMQNRERLGVSSKSGLMAIDPDNINSYKVRKGLIGGYKHELCLKDQFYVEDYVKKNLNEYFQYYLNY